MTKLWNLLLTVVATAIGVWAVVTFVPGIDLVPPAPGPDSVGVGSTNEPGSSATFMVIAALFILVNATVMPVLKFLGAPISCVTFGLFNLVIQAATFYIVAWLLRSLDLGLGTLEIRSLFAAILGTIVMGLVTGMASLVTGVFKVRN